MKKYIILNIIALLFVTSFCFGQKQPIVLPQIVGYKPVLRAQASVGYGTTPSQAMVNTGWYGRTSFSTVRPMKVGCGTLWVAKKVYTAPAFTEVYSRSSVNSYLKSVGLKPLNTPFQNANMSRMRHNNISNRNTYYSSRANSFSRFR